jgi:hypothetical protein
MAKIVSKPEITYKCDSCGAICSAGPDEFRDLNTMPPTWMINCAFCNNDVRCSPTAMIALKIGGLT